MFYLVRSYIYVENALTLHNYKVRRLKNKHDYNKKWKIK